MSIWDHIHRHLILGHRLALLTVIESNGSSPGRKGFTMVVDTAGAMTGSIGGGIMEQKLVELARSRLIAGNFSPMIKYQVHRKEATHHSGMICSGEQTVAIYLLDASHVALVERIMTSLHSGREGVLELNESGISFKETKPDSIHPTIILAENKWAARLPVGFKNRIYILGGGHVGLALSIAMRQIGFYVEIFDDRSDLNTMEMNQAAHQKHFIDYRDVGDHIPEGDQTYVAIVSFGYRTDKAVLKTLANRKYKYLGMMGSEEKVKKVMAELLEEGVSPQFLNSVHTPIGLPIHSKTPEEIAVSIAAEIIKLANE